MFNLPAFLYTAPEIARNILVYRWRTLDGARRKAARLGYEGAYYAWISGTSGDELCPDFFFDDVLTGRPIRNHFNVWQMHVSPDIALTVDRYWEVTGDDDFVVEYGAEIVFEVATFLALIREARRASRPLRDHPPARPRRVARERRQRRLHEPGHRARARHGAADARLDAATTTRPDSRNSMPDPSGWLAGRTCTTGSTSRPPTRAPA